MKSVTQEKLNLEEKLELGYHTDLSLPEQRSLCGNPLNWLRLSGGSDAS